MNRRIPIFIWLLLILFGCSKDADEGIYTGVLEGRSIQVPALAGGKILQLRVDTGQTVQAGDTLALIDTTELDLQFQQFCGALKELQAQIEIAGTALRRSQADLDYVSEKYQRVQSLVKNQSVPQQNLDDLANQLQQAQAGNQTAKQNFQVLAARREQLLAQQRLVQKKITDATILAPTEGVIFNKYFEESEVVPPMNPVVELIHIRDLDVKIYVAEKTLPKIRVGQEVKIRADGLDQEMTGILSWISPKAEFTPKAILTPENRTSLVYAVKIIIANPEGVLKHGMPVTVVL